MTSELAFKMTGSQFQAWRESHGLTQSQIAERMKVTRTTIQNWEAMTDRVPPAAEMMAEVLDVRLKQENPLLGPVTLIYSDGPMFIHRRNIIRSPQMKQEPYASNARALARVQELAGSEGFDNAFIVARGNEMIWNVVQLDQVVRGRDTNAPTLINMLRSIANAVREGSSIFVRSGAKTLSPEQTAERRREIVKQADDLDLIADGGLEVAIDQDREIEAIFKKLIDLGTRAPDTLVSGVAHAQEQFWQNRMRLPEPRIVGPDWVIDYGDFQISYPRIPQMTNHWNVMITSEMPYLFAKLGSDYVINRPRLDDAIRAAVLRINQVRNT